MAEYTEQQLIGALRKADAAGDTEAARAIARRIQAMRTQEWQPKRRTVEDLRAEAQDHDATEGMTFGQKFAAGLGKSIVDTGRGLKQLGQELFGDDTPTMSDLITGDSPDARRRREVDRQRAIDADLMDSGAGMAGNIVGQIGQMAIPVGGGVRLASMAGRAAPYIGAAARSAGFAATQPVATGESRGGQAAAAGTLGIAGQGIASGATRLGKGAMDRLSPEVLAVYNRAREAGIPVHFSQLSDSRFVKTLASTLGYLPFSGAAKTAAAQQQAFNRAVGRSFGAEDAASLSDDVMSATRQRLGASYDDIYGRNVVRADDELLGDLAAIEQSAARNLPANEAVIVKNQIDDILEAAGDTGMPGAQYQAFRTDRLLPLEGGQKSFQSSLIRDVRKALDKAAERSVGPEDAKALAITRRQYRNMKTAEKALGRVDGAVEGNVRPSSLWPIVSQKGGATPEMRELARIGQLLKNPIPDSGTAGRLLATGAVGSTGLGLAGSDSAGLSQLGLLLLAGATAGRLGNSQAAAKYLARGNKPLRGLARLVRPAPLVLPAAARASDD